MKSFSLTYRFLSSDESIWTEVYFRNQYNLPALSPSDVVVDVGAHTGAFTCGCLARGGRRIIAFKPDPDSFALAFCLGQVVVERHEKSPHCQTSLTDRLEWFADGEVEVPIESNKHRGDMINDRLEALSVLAAVEEQSTMSNCKNVPLRSQ